MKMKKPYLSLILVCLIPLGGLLYLVNELAKDGDLSLLSLSPPVPLQLTLSE